MWISRCLSTSRKLRKAGCSEQPADWDELKAKELMAKSHLLEFAAIFFTMASTSLRSLSFRLVA
jgi:hypothetical protein